jgi:hypothetical protein
MGCIQKKLIENVDFDRKEISETIDFLHNGSAEYLLYRFVVPILARNISVVDKIYLLSLPVSKFNYVFNQFLFSV